MARSNHGKAAVIASEASVVLENTSNEHPEASTSADLKELSVETLLKKDLRPHFWSAYIGNA